MNIQEIALSELERMLVTEPARILNGLWPIRVPLFRHANLVVDTKASSGGRKILCRSREMEDMLGTAAVRLRDEMDRPRPKFLSIVYILLADEPEPSFYLGICRRWGKVKILSDNIRSVKPGWKGLSQFARWGDGRYWHIGELSDALFAGGRKHVNWAADLFAASKPPTLKREVRFSCFLIRNEGELPRDAVAGAALDKRVEDAERQLIRRLQGYGLKTLNVQGKNV